MQSMELHIKVCEETFAGQPKYELLIPLSFIDDEISREIHELIHRIKFTEAYEKALQTRSVSTKR